jgi:adenosylcobinamide-GDP ribazoletransferase
LAASFSLYSRFPTPRFQWTEDDFRRCLVFLPCVGLAIGAIILGVAALFNVVEIPLIGRMAILSAIPLLATGGFHVDGFLDVQDALRSYRSRDEKLAIMKDPRVGAFAIVSLLTYALIWAASLSVALDAGRFSDVAIFALSFFVVRALCGATSLRLPKAREGGMLERESRNASAFDFWALAAQALVGAAVMIALDALVGAALVLGLAFFTLRYRRLCLREFGGVTGDTAGYFVVVGENVALTAIALAILVRGAL